MSKLKIAVIALAILLLAGCVATAIAYPFFGRTSPPSDVGNNDPGPGQDPEPGDPQDPGQDPQPDPEPDPNLIPRPQYVRGVYLSGNGAGHAGLREPILQLLRDSELNSLVIDVKRDDGYVTYKDTNVQLALEAKANANFVDMRAFMETLREEQIYPIARIVVVKDKFVSQIRPEWFLQHKNGSIWKDKNGNAWADLRNKEYWDYLVDLAIEAAEIGFREIQFDYIRWPSGGDGKVSDLASIPAANMTSQGPYERSEIVSSFLAYAKERLDPLGVDVSADTFGIMGTVKNEQTVGQHLEEILASEIHAISPMIYPSHYWEGTYGFKVPDQQPFGVVRQSTLDHLVRMEAYGSEMVMRPWLQDFTASWVPGYIRYGVNEIHAQIRALEDLGVKEYLFWNAGNKYTEEAYRTWQSND